MATNNMNNLVTLIKRLEAATSRLEDIATTTLGPPEGDVSNVADDVTTKIGAAAPGNAARTATPPTPPPLPPAIIGFDKLIDEQVKKFVSLSDGVGGLVAEQAASVMRAFGAERKFLIVTTKAKRPDLQSPAYMATLKELQDTIETVDGIRVANRGSPLSGHLLTVAEGIPMLAWLNAQDKPTDFVTEMFNACQYHGNRVYKEYKDKDKSHTDWLHSYYALCKGLKEYIENYYPSGLTWNDKDGIDAQEALKQVDAGELTPKPATSNVASAPPPPPPPPLPPAGYENATPAAKAGGAPDMGAVFEQISKGEGITAGLRKVDPSQQTHKNPALRATAGGVPTRSDSVHSNGSTGSNRGASPVPGRKPDSMRTKKPPRKALEGTKWIIENYDNPPKFLEIETQIAHSILITNCTKTRIRVRGKGNAISVDSSNGVSLAIESLVSAVDVIKTQRFEIQVLGKLPTIMLDQVDGAALYLSKESIATEIFTSKCTGININVPMASNADDDADYRECPVPEQFKSVIKNGRIVSEIVEHAG